MKVTLQVVESNNNRLLLEKDQLIQWLVSDNNYLEGEAEKCKRAMDASKNASQQLRSIIESKTIEIEMRSKYNELMEKMIPLQTVNNEITILNRTIQSDMKEIEP